MSKSEHMNTTNQFHYATAKQWEKGWATSIEKSAARFSKHPKFILGRISDNDLSYEHVSMKLR